MTNLGSSAAALEMVEMGSSRNETQKSRDEQEKKDKEDFSCLNLPDLDGLSLDDSKTTLEVDSVPISDKGGEDSEDDDFEVIPLPDCFNLEVPFELIDQGESEGEGNNKVNSVDVGGTKSQKAAEEDSKKPLEEAIEAVRLLEEKLSGSKGVQLPSIPNDLDIWLEPKALRVGTLKDNEERKAVSQLVEIGFANREENLRLLRKNGGDMNKVLQSLSNDQATWAEKRHLVIEEILAISIKL